MMRPVRLLLLWASLGANCAFAEPSNELIRLTGIVDLPELRLAIIESKPAAAGVSRGLWGAGERIASFELQAINSENGSVGGILHGTNVVFRLTPTASQPAPPPSLQLEQASVDLVLKLYSRLSNRSVLQSTLLPAGTVTATSGLTNRSEVLALLERRLADHGVVLVPDGEKFVAALTETEAAGYAPKSPPRRTDGSTPAADDIPPGSINFQPVPLLPCVTIYAEFAGKKLDRASVTQLPDRRVVFFNQNTLTKEECLYAFATLLRMQGVELQPAEDGLLKAVLIREAKR